MSEVMKKITTIFLCAFVIVAGGCNWVGIQGNRHMKADLRPVSTFSNIDARGAFEIEWQNGPPTLRIVTDENLLRYIKSDVTGDTLHLHSREQLRPTHGVRVLITSPTREGAKITGAVKLTANQLSGARFAVESSGAARVTLDGTVDQLLADMSGASRLTASGLQTRTAEISTTGAGKAEVAVSEVLKVAITGAGKVEYSGNPATVEKHISGAGSIRRKD